MSCRWYMCICVCARARVCVDINDACSDIGPHIINLVNVSTTNTHANPAIVRTFDKIARKHKVTYWLVSGTLIGALRRGGIIPWDGDADVAMLEEDYHRLKLVLHKELPRGMYFQTACESGNFTWGVRKPLECDSHWEKRYNTPKIKVLCSTYVGYRLFDKWGVSGALVVGKMHSRVVGVGWAKSKQGAAKKMGSKSKLTWLFCVGSVL